MPSTSSDVLPPSSETATLCGSRSVATTSPPAVIPCRVGRLYFGRMPPELSPARRRSRKLWRRIRSVAALLPPIGFQWLRHLLWHGSTLPISHPRTLTHHLFLKMARDRN